MKYFCSNCGIEIDEETFKENEGMCTDCFFEYYQQIDDLESDDSKAGKEFQKVGQMFSNILCYFWILFHSINFK